MVAHDEVSWIYEIAHQSRLEEAAAKSLLARSHELCQIATILRYSFCHIEIEEPFFSLLSLMIVRLRISAWIETECCFEFTDVRSPFNHGRGLVRARSAKSMESMRNIVFIYDA